MRKLCLLIILTGVVVYAFAQSTLPRTYDYDKQIRKVEPTRPNEKFPMSIISIKKEHETSVFHPTQKPVDLLRYLVLTYSNTGG